MSPWGWERLAARAHQPLVCDAPGRGLCSPGACEDVPPFLLPRPGWSHLKVPVELWLGSQKVFLNKNGQILLKIHLLR